MINQTPRYKSRCPHPPPATGAWCWRLGPDRGLACVTKRNGSSGPSSLAVASCRGSHRPAEPAQCGTGRGPPRPGRPGDGRVGPRLCSVQFSQFRGPQPARNKYFQDISLGLETWISTRGGSPKQLSPQGWGVRQVRQAAATFLPGPGKGAVRCLEKRVLVSLLQERVCV